MNEHEFYTEEVDGIEVAGILFDTSDGGFYEFQDPAEHDDYERLEDPRTGEVLAFDGRMQQLMADVMAPKVRATVPAEEWAEFRQTYIGADEPDHERWADAWRDMAEADPRFDGAVNA